MFIIVRLIFFFLVTIGGVLCSFLAWYWYGGWCVTRWPGLSILLVLGEYWAGILAMVRRKGGTADDSGIDMCFALCGGQHGPCWWICEHGGICVGVGGVVLLLG